MKIKIGILTQPLKSNYGGIIQAWALQKHLIKNGYEVVTLDISYFKQPSLIFKLIHTAKVFFEKNILRRERNYIFFNDNNEIINGNLTQFIKDNINMSDIITSKKSLYNCIQNLGLNTIIVGSDQVWRPKYSPYLPIYFFKGIDDRITKITYAASFGVDTWEYSDKETLLYTELCKKISAISVREKTGVDLSRQYFNVTAEHVLDPTMLITKEEYLSLVGSKFKIKVSESSKRCFTYILDDNDEKRKTIKDICKAKGLISCSLNEDQEIYRLNNKHIYVKEPLEMWLANFEAADFIVTDSFHGCVFSIIFNKPFYVLLNEKRGSSRFYSLLDLFDLTDRLLPTCIHEDINWTLVNDKLLNMQLKSKCFLKKHIEKI